ncbi:hydroxymethylglutaryl-CoA lyase [Clostridium sediminicola]|uniref:hydroxymethylglutaryl-CoA lyase n=1 Tax=Clostridium sediminicola TaxID=3114879 RepID=UPI0031F23D67
MKLPSNVNIIEVGPRDGFQNISKFIPTNIKLEVIDAIVNAGFKKIQVTSFVHPKAIPQMKDAREVVETVTKKYNDIIFTALVPNLFGAKAAYECGIREISYVISASESHNKENVRRSIKESFEELNKIRLKYKDLRVKIDIATAFGCPFEGTVPVAKIVEMIKEAHEIGVDDIFLADTIGVANPKQVEEILEHLIEKFPNEKFGLHMHDTRGMGLANILVALQKGFTIFESSTGGLGGCPFAPGAAGNIASEDLVNILGQMGIETGVELNKLYDAINLIKKYIKPDLTSHMGNICIK